MATRKGETPKRAAAKGQLGRPSKWKPEYMEQGRKLCLLGLTDAEMADLWGVSERTINEWKKSVPGFSQSIARGKVLADADMAERLYERGMGYSHAETVINCYQGVILKTKVTRHYPPDTQAAVTWLERRDPERWRKRDADEGDENAPPPVQVVLEVKSARLRPDDPDADAQ